MKSKKKNKKKHRVHIRKIKSIEEYEACEKLQKTIWQFEEREIIPKNELITVQREGGVVLGAFARKKMIGFVFGLLGIRDNKLIHCSRMLAILPQFRNKNMGFKLKLAQREFVLKQGIELISWTFDPLQAKNAYFNIEKLGAVTYRYLINLYGYSTSILNKGLPTDRFLISWHIKSDRVKKFLKNIRPEIDLKKTHYLNEISFNKKNLPVSSEIKLANYEEVAIRIPNDIDVLKAKDNNLALDWRYKTRDAFTKLLKQNYIVTRFRFDESSSGVYIFSKVAFNTQV